MYRRIKAAIDMDDITSIGMEAAWADKQNRDDIIKYVYTNMTSKELLTALEDNMDEDQFGTVIVALAKGLTE